MSLRFVILLLSPTVASVISAQVAPPADRTAYAVAVDSIYARPINRARIAFAFPEKDLLAENLAFNPRDSSFLIGSTRYGKISRRAKNGAVTDFIPPRRDGLWMVIGMKVDTLRSVLWVNSAAGSNLLGHTAADRGKTALFKYELRSGRLLTRYLPADSGRHFFNDLVIADDGRVFVTDMVSGAIYSLPPGATSSVATIERWAQPQGLESPNGIALDDRGRTLYVATDRGIAQFDVTTRQFALLPTASGIESRGIDGLYWHRNTLIGVQGGRLNRVQRFVLSADRARIERAEVLEANHPMFMNPTTGVVVGDELYLVANSQFSSIDDNGVLLPLDRLFETVILRLPLRQQ